MKLCRKCKEEKPKSQFNKDKYNPDGLKLYCKPCDRGYVSNWTKNNPDKAAAKGARRRSAQLERRPKWIKDFFKDQVDEYYVMAKALETIFPWKQHVDHIRPMQGKLVCGLDVPWNLQILSVKANLEKGNRDVEEDNASPLPEGHYHQGKVYTQFGIIPASGFGKNGDYTYHHCGTICREDFDHSTEASRRNSMGRGSEKVGAPKKPKSKQDPRQLLLPFDWPEC